MMNKNKNNARDATNFRNSRMCKSYSLKINYVLAGTNIKILTQIVWVKFSQ